MSFEAFLVKNRTKPGTMIENAIPVYRSMNGPVAGPVVGRNFIVPDGNFLRIIERHVDQITDYTFLINANIVSIDAASMEGITSSGTRVGITGIPISLKYIVPDVSPVVFLFVKHINYIYKTLSSSVDATGYNDMIGQYVERGQIYAPNSYCNVCSLLDFFSQRSDGQPLFAFSDMTADLPYTTRLMLEQFYTAEGTWSGNCMESRKINVETFVAEFNDQESYNGGLCPTMYDEGVLCLSPFGQTCGYGPDVLNLTNMLSKRTVRTFVSDFVDLQSAETDKQYFNICTLSDMAPIPCDILSDMAAGFVEMANICPFTDFTYVVDSTQHVSRFTSSLFGVEDVDEHGVTACSVLINDIKESLLYIFNSRSATLPLSRITISKTVLDELWCFVEFTSGAVETAHLTIPWYRLSSASLVNTDY